MYESNPTAIIPPPGNPRAFDLGTDHLIFDGGGR